MPKKGKEKYGLFPANLFHPHFHLEIRPLIAEFFENLVFHFFRMYEKRMQFWICLSMQQQIQIILIKSDQKAPDEKMQMSDLHKKNLHLLL